MAPWNLLVRAFLVFEDSIVNILLRSPTFHRGVQRIHRRVDEFQNGPSPTEGPLRQGEASRDPESVTSRGFMKHFVDELRNQARGNPTDAPPPPPRNQPPSR